MAEGLQLMCGQRDPEEGLRCVVGTSEGVVLHGEEGEGEGGEDEDV